MPVVVERAGAPHPRESGPQPRWLEIGLVNNMPDAALEAAERQFSERLSSADGPPVRLHLFSLSGIPRGPAAQREMAGRYGTLADLERKRLDGLIVTGAEPLAARLEDEAYWSELVRVIDWAEQNTASTLFSCLAAHAAVLHLDGIVRRRLPAKTSGLFECVAALEDPLLSDAPSGMRVAHSRWHDLDEALLRRHGYRIVSRSHEAGIDIFTKRWTSLFVFLQGHPEYDSDTLYREFRRDARRHAFGERAAAPAVPRHYFDSVSEQAFQAYLDQAQGAPRPETWAEFPRTWSNRPGLTRLSDATSAMLFRNWLRQVESLMSVAEQPQ